MLIKSTLFTTVNDSSRHLLLLREAARFAAEKGEDDLARRLDDAADKFLDTDCFLSWEEHRADVEVAIAKSHQPDNRG